MAVHTSVRRAGWLLHGVLALLGLVGGAAGADVAAGVQLVTEFSNRLVPKIFQAMAPGRDNLVFAPYGLATNIAMLLEGADGSTAQEIMTAFNISPDLRSLLRTGFKAYSDNFEASSEGLNEEAAGAFNVALLRSSQHLTSHYSSLLVKYFRTNITETFAFENATGSRPSAQTLELRSDAGVMSHWKDYQRLAVTAFLSQQTAAPFYRAFDDVINVPMIPQSGVFRAGHIGYLKTYAIELPLEVNTLNLLLMIPDSVDDMDETLVRLSNISFGSLGEFLTHAQMEVSLPQLSIVTSGLDYTAFLRQLGVREAFNATAANFSKAVGKKGHPMYVKSITQDAFFSTSFVAVNSVGSVSSNLVARRPKRNTEPEADSSLLIDRPFLFFLFHRDTQLVLLAGKVHNPTQVP